MTVLLFPGPIGVPNEDPPLFIRGVKKVVRQLTEWLLQELLIESRDLRILM